MFLEPWPQKSKPLEPLGLVSLGAPETYKSHDFEARPFDIENAICVWNRALCLDRTTISWRGIFVRRKNRWPQQTWKSWFYKIYGASQRQPNVRLCWIQGKSPLWILIFFFGKLPDLDFPIKIKHSALRKNTKPSPTRYICYLTIVFHTFPMVSHFISMSIYNASFHDRMH